MAGQWRTDKHQTVMSIWGKILGGAAGFAIGGPLGALMGAVAGHAVDKMRVAGGDEAEDATKRIAFTIAVIALGAKMAKADGKVTRDEVDAFKRVFRIPPEEAKNVGRVFDQARRDVRGFEPYARQISGMFADNPVVLEELLNGLFHIARADGEIAAEELAYLQQVSQIFGFDSDRWERVRAGNMGPDQSDPYEIIGVPRDAADVDIKSAYRKLVREHHPDRLVAQGLPQEFIDLANEKLATINSAYDSIQQSRGFS